MSPNLFFRMIVTLAMVCMTVVGNCSQKPEPLDVLIIHGTLVDGSKNIPQVLSLGIRGDKIVYIGPDTTLAAKRVVDASNLIVTPGFIDPHTHADADLRSAEKRANAAWLFQGVTTVIIGSDGGGEVDYEALGERLSRHGTGTNVAQFTGHGALRRTVMGADNRAPTTTELLQMKSLLATAMEQGSLGLSSGLFYAPGSFSKTDELIALAGIVADYNGVHDSHIRDESDYSIGLLGSIEEIIEISRQSGVAGHISHIKALGPSVWGQSQAVIDLIDDARLEGLQITANQYPWLASGTHLGNALVPREMMDGGKPAMLLRLQDKKVVAKIRPQMQANLIRRGGADALLITGNSQWRGKTLAEISRLTSSEPVDAAIAIILDGDLSVASFMMQERDVERLMRQPWVVTGSDGSQGHPRKYATFPKKYQKYVQRRSLLTLSEFVRRSSSLTAEILNLCDRGYLLKGYRADVALWSRSGFQAMADYQNPEKLAQGVHYLLVNGEFVIDDGTLTPSRTGQLLARQSCITNSDTRILNNN